LSDKKDFSVSVSGTTNKAVDWFVNGVAGGDAVVGTINGDGLYSPPVKVPSPNKVIIKAVARADRTKSDTSEVNLLNLVPLISALEPSYINVNRASVIVVKGSRFIASAKVQIEDRDIATKFISDKELSFSWTTGAAPGTEFNVTVVNPNPGEAESSPRHLRVLAPVALSVRPEQKTMRCGTSYDFSASVSNTTNKAVKWHVNNVAGGNAALGTINAEGVYTAPMEVPAGGKVTLKAISDADPRATDTADVTLLNPVPAISAVTPDTVKIGPVSLVVKGTGFARTARLMLGSTQLQATWVSYSEIRGTGNVAAQVAGIAPVVVENPDPGEAESNAVPVPVKPIREVMSLSAAVRFLEQAAWGPSPASLADLQQKGSTAWLEEQFNLPPSTFPDPQNEDEGLGGLQRAFFAHALHGKDQLRQRVAFALSQILVTSGVEAGKYHQMVPYQRLLAQHAFANYLDLMREVTLSPTMGIFLDMVNNDKPDPRRNFVPNENYARELLQLFTIGLYELDPKGQRKLDPTGNPIPAYTEETVKELTLALTGWTFPPQPGFASRWRNPPYFFGQMVPFEEHHDQTAKTLLNGVILPPGRTAQEDMEAALRNIFAHPNVGPFVSYRLIQRLVTSGPSPDYVGRVAAAFDNNGRGTRGDLKAVVRAILLDPEAGNAAINGPPTAAAPVLPPGQGHLREPALYVINLLRALDATTTEPPALATQTRNMGQNVYFAPSVFNYFSPFYRIPGTMPPVTAPEFQILNPTTATARANFAWRAVRNAVSSTVRVDLTNFESLASDPPKLVDAVSNTLLRGQMPAEMRTSILTALQSTTDRRTRASIALYLAAVSAQYQVQR
jgi:uncharacterized protein (DUF1800 family)